MVPGADPAKGGGRTRRVCADVQESILYNHALLGPAEVERVGIGGDGEEGTVYVLLVERRRMMGHRKAVDIRADVMYFHLQWKLAELLFDLSSS